MKNLSFLLVVFSLLITSALFAQSDKDQQDKNIKTTLGVTGMTCQGCVNSVKKTLDSIDGVEKYEVSLEDGEAVVEFDPAKTSIEKIEKKFEKTPIKLWVKQRIIKLKKNNLIF